MIIVFSFTGAEDNKPARPDGFKKALQSLIAPEFRTFINQISAARRRASTARVSDWPESQGRSGNVRPVTLSEGLWIFGGSIAFSVAKVLGLSLLYYVAPEFVENWGPTFG